MAFIRTFIFYPVFYLGSVPFVVMAFLGIWFSPKMLKWAPMKWSQYHHDCCKWVLGVRVEVVGQLSDEPVLYAIKHESMFETIDMPRFFNFPVVVAKKQLLSIPLWGRAAKAYGMIFVDREAGAAALRDLVRQSNAAKSQRRPVIIFPEGTRVQHGQQPELRAGLAGLYKILKVPIVPIALDSGKLGPKGKRIWQSGTITYLVGEPIPPGLPRKEMEKRVHSAINALNN